MGSHGAMENITERLALFISEMEWRQLPGEALETGKLHILDTLGCILVGAGERASEIITAHVNTLGGTQEATLIPWGFKTNAPYAALVNGVSGHVLDYDDYEWPSMAHPSVTVLPAVLAIAEKIGASGREFLIAYLTGMEVISKIGPGVNPNHYDKGWHSTGTLGTLGAAAASSRVLKLDVDTTRMAMGIAASQSGGLRENFGTMTKCYHAGHAARSGVEAALLASRGFTASRNILESDLGFCNLFTEQGGFDLKKITAHLGNPFSMVSPGVGIKSYPSCAATHSSIDAMFELIHRFDIRAEDVESVECGIFYLYPSMLIHSDPKTGLEGKFSLEFCMALALKERRIGLGDFTDSKAQEPEIRELVKKVKKFVSKEVGERGTQYPGATIKVNLKNGKSHSHKTEKRKGSPANPLSFDEVVNKFMDCAKSIHPRDQAKQILNTVLDLENQNDMGTLIKLLLTGND